MNDGRTVLPKDVKIAQYSRDGHQDFHENYNPNMSRRFQEGIKNTFSTFRSGSKHASIPKVLNIFLLCKLLGNFLDVLFTDLHPPVATRKSIAVSLVLARLLLPQLLPALAPLHPALSRLIKTTIPLLKTQSVEMETD